MIFLVEKNMRVERHCTCGYLNHEQFYWQYEICKCSHQKYRYEEVRGIVAFGAKVRPRDEMIFGIVGVVKVDVVAEELAAHCAVAELVVHECLRK